MNNFNCIYFLFLGLILSCQPKKTTDRPLAELNKAVQTIAVRSKTEILVAAHRSFHKNAPENSLQSVKDAIENGIDIIELDVRTTKDDSLVIMHDKTVDRTTNGTGNVRDYTYLKLKELNLKIDDSITLHRVPSLYEVLAAVNTSDIIINIDQKDANIRQLHQFLSRFGMEHRVISYTGSWENTKSNTDIDPFFAVMPLAKTGQDLRFFCDSLKSPLIHLTNATFTAENMNALKQKDKYTFVNTLWKEDVTFITGNSKDMDSVILLRPSIIQTDYPDLLINYLKKKGLHK